MAPSPTGFLQIGNLRTYLFNYLFAKNQGGKLVLRIEDTDIKRTVPNGTKGIIESLEIMGIFADEGPNYGGEYGPYVQTQRRDIYLPYAKELVSKGHAYYCFCSQERLDKLRETQKSQKLQPKYDGLCRNISLEDAQKRVDAGEPHVIRLKIPVNEKISFDDVVYGHMEFDSNLVDDQVLIKTDGLPTYHFGVVIDDYLMKVNYIIRADEWISSTPKHVLLYKYLGWELPTYAHVPLVLNPDGKGKLSKRKADVAVLSYFRQGYILEGMRNFIVLLGWSPDPKIAHQDEIYDYEFLVKNFDVNRIKRPQARFQVSKLDAINSAWIKRLTVDQLMERIYQWNDIVQKELVMDTVRGISDEFIEYRKEVNRLTEYLKADPDRAIKLVTLVQIRIDKFNDLLLWFPYLYKDVNTDITTVNAVCSNYSLKPLEVVNELESALYKLDNWQQELWESGIRSLADKYKMKHGDLFMILRIIVTGAKISPPLRELMEIIGRDFVQKRFNTLKALL